MISSPNVGGIPSAPFRSLGFASGACGLCHPVHFTIRIFWDMRAHVVISIRFGIVGSLRPSYSGLLVFVSLRIGYNRMRFCSRNGRLPWLLNQLEVIFSPTQATIRRAESCDIVPLLQVLRIKFWHLVFCFCVGPEQDLERLLSVKEQVFRFVERRLHLWRLAGSWFPQWSQARSAGGSRMRSLCPSPRVCCSRLPAAAVRTRRSSMSVAAKGGRALHELSRVVIDTLRNPWCCED